MASKRDEIYVAIESFSWEPEPGKSDAFHKGLSRVRGDHPVLRANPMYFQLVDANVGVEAATAAPGEKRGQ